MLTIRDIVELLGFSQSPFFYTEKSDLPEDLHYKSRLLNEACRDSLCAWHGVMATQCQADAIKNRLKIALLVASANDIASARRLHQSVWNSGFVPFLLIELPNQIRLYNCYDFDSQKELGCLKNISKDSTQRIMTELSPCQADKFESGLIWNSPLGKQLSKSHYVHSKLLKNLGELSKCLRERCSRKLPSQMAHTLIGKYMYLRFLIDREIITEQWLRGNGLEKKDFLGDSPTVHALRKVCSLLENRFNGGVFSIDFDASDAPDLEHVKLTASVFSGDDLVTTNVGWMRQLCFDFANYNFRFIPVETLSRVYQQFLHVENRGKSKGAYYTPESLADYLLAELDDIEPSRSLMKILDPSCGSGVFLALAYRRLIEKELLRQTKERLSPDELKSILETSIYGVEREPEACNVTVFSLILTMLHHADPNALHENHDFKFPSLLNSRIFMADFFDENSNFRKMIKRENLKFDRIIGNPPWLKISENSQNQDDDQFHARQWLDKHENPPPIPQKQVETMFAWKCLDLLTQNGLSGLVLPAALLLNHTALKFRKSFLRSAKLERVTNFSNLRAWLFGKATLPASTWIFRRGETCLNINTSTIIHCAPLALEQMLDTGTDGTLAIHERDISLISYPDAVRETYPVWKLAQWGGERHRKTLKRLKKHFPLSFMEFCRQMDWGENFPVEGPQFRSSNELNPNEKYRHMPEFAGELRFNAKKFNETKNHEDIRQRFLMQNHFLDRLSEHDCWLRMRGGQKGIEAFSAPHLLISHTWGNYFIYSDIDFHIPPRRFGVSCPPIDAVYLKALSVYLYSTIPEFFLFYHSPEFGVYTTKNTVTIKDVRKIPVPQFNRSQAETLSELHEALLSQETDSFFSAHDVTDETERRKRIDEAIFDMFEVPLTLVRVLNDFRQWTLPLASGKGNWKELAKQPDADDLNEYAEALENALDSFARRKCHKVTAEKLGELTCCVIHFTHEKDRKKTKILPQTNALNAQFKNALHSQLRRNISTNIYLQRGLRIFELRDNKTTIFKPSRRIDWSPTTALDDADDIIAEILEIRQ